MENKSESSKSEEKELKFSGVELTNALGYEFKISPRTIKTDINIREVKSHLLSLDTLLNIALKGSASDLLLKVGQVPMFRVNGEVYPLRDGPRIDRDMMDSMVAVFISTAQIAKLEALEDVDMSYATPKGIRCRVNIFRQRSELGMVLRIVKSEVPTSDSLGMGDIIKSIAEYKRGLVLVTGATGSGKSTTLAAMINHINKNFTRHILTIEDPIEFLHGDLKSMVNQRELGLDSKNFACALRGALRQSPDVILVGELRDAETMEVALEAAETGHLVFSTIHTNDAADALQRIMSCIGSAKEAIVRTQLAESLRAVISQRLVRRLDKKGRVAAQEILINTATIREKILKGATPGIVRDFIAQGQNYGMQTFDQHLFYLYQEKIIDYEAAWTNATNRDDFDLKARGIGSDSND